MELALHHVDGGHAVANFGPILIRVITTAPTDIHDLDELRPLLDATLESYSWIALWVVVHHGAPVPDLSTRRHAGTIFKPYADKMALVYSMLGLGFWSSLALAATKSFGKFVGMQAQVEASVEAAAQRLAFECVGVDPAELAAIHARLLADITAAATASARPAK